MLFKVTFLLTILWSASLAFQTPTTKSEERFTLGHEHYKIASSSTRTRINTCCTRSAHHLYRHGLSRNICLQNKREENDENDEKKDEEQQASIPQRNIFESIWESSFFTSFLFWAPFVFNPKLRLRFTNFLSEYLDLRIAIPVSLIGAVGAVTYVTYQNQILDIELACSTTEESLKVLREIRTAQMTGTGVSGSGSGGDTIDKEYEMALENYDYTLREELKLRNNFVMLPLKVPNAPEGPDRAAAKQFLGMEIDESGELIP